MDEDNNQQTGVKPVACGDALAAQVTIGFARLLPRSAIALARSIGLEDADRLWPEERADFGRAVQQVLAESGAARVAARDLMSRLGQPPSALRRGATRAVVWPPGFVGSLSHTKTMAVAALARTSGLSGLGIDIEPPLGLDPALAAIILTEREARCVGADPLKAHLLFSIKEAVFKAVHPIDGVFLDFKDVELNTAGGIARTCYGRTVRWSAASAPMLMAAAWIPAGDAPPVA